MREIGVEDLQRHSNDIESLGVKQVVFSGGEPLMQRRFVVKLLAGAKRLGIHTTIETNGFLGADLTDDDLGTIDLDQKPPQKGDFGKTFTDGSIRVDISLLSGDPEQAREAMATHIERPLHLITPKTSSTRKNRAVSSSPDGRRETARRREEP